MITPHSEAHSHGGADSARLRPHWPRVQAAKLWPWAPVLLLAALIGTQLLVLSSALDDPGFATESDYYRKAVDWDAHMARARQSQALGWAARATSQAMADGGVALALELVDARRQAIHGARVHGVALHMARASHEHELELAEVSPGVYRAPLGVVRPGVWEVHIAAARGADLYEAVLRFDVVAAGADP